MDGSLAPLLSIDRSFLFGILGVTVAGLVSVCAFYKMGSSMGIHRNIQRDFTENKEKEKKQEIEDKYPNGNLSIYFGSQTGTAEGFARTLMEDCRDHGYNAKVIDLEDFDENILASTNIAIFLMATYGEGEPTDNANKFYKWLKNDDKEIHSNFLNLLHFCVFGLGNRQYEHFNRMGKLTDQYLEELGAQRLFPLGLGDDDGSLEDDFDKWRESIWSSIPNKSSNVTRSNSIVSTGSFKEIDYLFSTVSSAKHAAKPQPRSNSIVSFSKHFYQAVEVTIKENRELRNYTNGHSFETIGSTRHIELDISQSGLTYETADNLSILPENDSVIVEALAQLLNYDLNYEFDFDIIKPDQFKYSFPVPSTVRTVLTKYLDIQGPVKHSLLNHLINFTTDDDEREWLINILSKENKALFNQVILDQHLSLYAILSTYLSSCKIPFDALLHITPTLQPRQYTISSSKLMYPKTIHITVAVANKIVSGGRVFKGLCSTFLKDSTNALIGGKCQVLVRASSFRLPSDLSIPLIMIGPGTGFAPMRAMLQERKYFVENNKSNVYGDITVYFGCRNETIDYIYRDEIEQYVNEKIITKLNVAFSRQGKEKVYVQHLMSKDENASKLWEDIGKGGYIFVCGALTMGSDVHSTLNNIVSKYGNMSTIQAEEFIQDLKLQGRYIQELWSS